MSAEADISALALVGFGVLGRVGFLVEVLAHRGTLIGEIVSVLV